MSDSFVGPGERGFLESRQLSAPGATEDPVEISSEQVVYDTGTNSDDEVDLEYKAKLQSFAFGAASWQRETQLRSAFVDIVKKRKAEH